MIGSVKVVARTYFGNGLSAGAFPGGSGVRPTLSTIEIIE